MSGGTSAYAGRARVMRGAILGCLVLAISLAGHTAVGGGALPESSTLVVLLGLAILLSIAVAHKRRSFLWLLADMAALQVLLHVIATAVMTHPGHPTGLIPSAPMLIGHVVATILAAGALTRADDLWDRWCRFLDDLARDFALAPLPTPLSGADIAAPQALPLVERYTTQPVLRRGPPALRAR